MPDFKEDDIALAVCYTLQLKNLNVPVYLNHPVTAKDVKNGAYDTVIIASGSTPKMFTLGEDKKVYTASQVLLNEKDCGNSTVVIGGGLVGCKTALWLAQKGKKVALVGSNGSIACLKRAFMPCKQ